MKDSLTGGCHCGCIRYEIENKIIKRADCDCRDCQKATGSLKAPFVSIKPEQFKVTTGELSEFQASKGERCDQHGHWGFCPKCGTKLAWMSNKEALYDVLLGTLDEPDEIQVTG